MLAGIWLRIAPWLVGLAFLFLYGMTTAPSIVTLFDDSLEFQLVLPTFGIAHPTGYPLFTLLGGLWSRVLFPFGNWAWRANLLSALAAATTVALVYVLASKLVAAVVDQPGAAWAGLAAAMAFGLVPIWWAQATLAEVYALHSLLVCAVLVTAIGIERTTGPAFDRRMTLLWFLVGLGVAHHRTIVLVLPGLAVYLLWSVPGIWRPRRVWWLWLAALAVPLLFYLYLPLRAGMGMRDLHGSYTNSWSGFWDHVLARGYTGFFTHLCADRRAVGRRLVGTWPGTDGLGQRVVGVARIGMAGQSHRTQRLGAHCTGAAGQSRLHLALSGRRPGSFSSACLPVCWPAGRWWRGLGGAMGTGAVALGSRPRRRRGAGGWPWAWGVDQS